MIGLACGAANEGPPVAVGALVGPQGDCYRPDLAPGADAAEAFHTPQIRELAATNADFQYLCCLNSDRIPTSGFPASLDWRNFVKLALRYGAPDGGLFGFRFGEGAGEHWEHPSQDWEQSGNTVRFLTARLTASTFVNAWF